MPTVTDTGVPARRLLIAIGVVAVVSLAIAFASQHLLGMEPCPWCIVQRLIAGGIAALAFAAAAIRGAAAGIARVVGGAGILLLSGLGVAAAWHQHTVAARQFSCSFTFADRLLMSLGLDRWWPGMFEVRATCADAAEARLLGLPFEWWSGALFVIIAAAVLWMAFGAFGRARSPRRVRTA
jgi:protein dithiol:quinone oxidoreductase